MIQLSTASYLAFNLAAAEAQALNHARIEIEHLLLGLFRVIDLNVSTGCPVEGVSEPDWTAALTEIQAWEKFLRQAVLPDIVTLRRRFRAIIQQQFPAGTFSGHRSDACRKLFAEAIQQPEALKTGSVSLFLLGRMVISSHSAAIDSFLQKNGLDADQLAASLGSQPDSRDIETENMTSARSQEPAPAEKPAKKTSTPTLDRFGRDVTQAAREGKLTPVIGRHDEMRKMIQTLLRSNKGNPLLVGDAGVGKTCLVEGLAQRIIAPDASERISSMRIIELNINSLVAGTKYRGDFEEKLDNVIKEAASDPNIILFMDEIHTLVGAGASGDGGGGAANVFKPALARGGIRCIGATTTEEYRRYLEKDMALTRRFQLIWVEEPSRSEAIEIMKGIRPHLEEHHMIKIPDSVIEKAVDLAIRYIKDYRLPDKATDILDQACAAHLFASFRPQADWQEPPSAELTILDIARVVAERCKVPLQVLMMDEKKKLLGLEDFLKSRIFGQDEAIEAVSESVRRARLGLRDPGKPLTVLFFLGSTGTGKTETAKCLAEYLFDDPSCLITVDLSEYQEKQDVAKLVGSPPGYIGHEEEGMLISHIRTRPSSVVLFDEVEKAAPEIYDIFLQIFDEGRLTDSRGRTVWFNESIVILTSNLGSRLETGYDKARPRIGFELADLPAELKPAAKQQDTDGDRYSTYRERILQAVSGKMRQEIIGRIKKLIFFYPLDKAAQGRIVARMLQKTNAQLADSHMQLVMDDAAIQLIVDSGFNPVYGARSTQQAFDRLVAEPLANFLLTSSADGVSKLQITASGGKLVFRPFAADQPDETECLRT